MSLQFLERPFEVKSVSDKGVFTGYASVFGELDSYRDVVMPGAFLKSLANDFAGKGRKVPMLWQHNSRQPIGIYDNIREDAHGLYVEGFCNMEVQQGRECHSLMKQGALTGLSIGFNTVTETWKNDEALRELVEVKLWEISPVTFPAGDSARASAKSLLEAATLSDVEAYLRDVHGLSRKEATAVVSRAKAIPQGDPADSAEAKALQTVFDTIRAINQGT